MSLAVVGVEYPNRDKAKSNRRFEVALCKPGDPVTLVLEPKNPADPNAVAVFSDRGTQLGYVTAERCGRIGALIREGREVDAVFQQAAPYGCIIRVAFDGEAPHVSLQPKPIVKDAVLPEGADPDFEFEPDPEWED